MHWQLVLENTGNDVVLIIPMCFIYNVRFDVFLKRLSHLPFFFVKDTERCPDNRKKSYRRVVLCSHLTSLGCWRIPRPSSSGPSNWDLKQKAEMATADRWPSQDGPLLSSQVLSLPRALITTNELAFTVNKPATSEMLGRQSACIWLLSGRGKWGKSWDTIPVCVPWYVKLLHNYRNARCLLSLYDRLERLNERANKAIQEGMGCQELADVTGLFSTGVVFSRSHFR